EAQLLMPAIVTGVTVLGGNSEVMLARSVRAAAGSLTCPTRKEVRCSKFCRRRVRRDERATDTGCQDHGSQQSKDSDCHTGRWNRSTCRGPARADELRNRRKRGGRVENCRMVNEAGAIADVETHVHVLRQLLSLNRNESIEPVGDVQ